MYEYVYGIIHFEKLRLKIGRWSGSISALRSRYNTYYVEFEMIVFETEKGASPTIEAQLHRACESFRIAGEVFSVDAMSNFLQSARDACLSSCRSTDYEERARRIERKRFADLAKENRALATKMDLLATKSKSLAEKKKAENAALAMENAALKKLIEQKQKECRDEQNQRKEQQKEKCALEQWLVENIVKVESVKSCLHLHRIRAHYEAYAGKSDRNEAIPTDGAFRQKLKTAGFVFTALRQRDKQCSCNNTAACIQAAELIDRTTHQ